jgi:uncharacterized membrane protein YeaQ/YmgE (transglycosylase-associated protein family)
MISIFIWCFYGTVVGSIAKSIVPGEEKMGFFQTIALGVAGSYTGGAVAYLLGIEAGLNPAGIVMGIGGAVLALILYNKVVNKK